MNDASNPDSHDNPIAPEVIEAAATALASLWKRIEKRAPEDMRARVEVMLQMVEAVKAAPTVKGRLELSKLLEDLGAELRGRKPWEATFYRDGRLGITRAQDPITIQGAVDHRRVEAFFDRYVKRAEAAFERLEYFYRRAGIADPKAKEERKPWDQAYANMDNYRELIWGKVVRPR